MLLKTIKKLWFYYTFKRNFLAETGNNTTVDKGVFSNSINIKIGNNVHIGQNAFWNALGGIDIQDNVIIGPNSTIWTYNHNYNSEKYLPYDELELLKRVIIEKNVWIGINVSVSPGVTIGEGSIIAMGSVVISDIPKCSIAGGNPAKVFAKRDEDLYLKLSAIPEGNVNYLHNKKYNNLKKKHFRVI